MALTKIKLNTGMVTGSLPDANIPNDITISGAQTGISSVGTLATAHIQGGQAYASSATNLSTTVSKKALRVQGSSDASTSLWMGSLANDAQQYIQACNDAGNGADDIVLNPFGGNVGIGIGNASPGYLTELRVNDTVTDTPRLVIRQLGTGDSSLAFQMPNSPYGWVMGGDNSDSDRFKISTGVGDLDSSPRFEIDPSGTTIHRYTGAENTVQIHSGTGSSTTGVSQIYFSSKDQYGGNTHQSYIKSTIDGSSSTSATKMTFHNRKSDGTVYEYMSINNEGRTEIEGLHGGTLRLTSQKTSIGGTDPLGTIQFRSRDTDNDGTLATISTIMARPNASHTTNITGEDGEHTEMIFRLGDDIGSGIEQNMKETLRLRGDAGNWAVQIDAHGAYGLKIGTTASNSSSHDMFQITRGDGTACITTWGDGNTKVHNEIQTKAGLRTYATNGGNPAGDFYNVAHKFATYRQTLTSSHITDGYVNFSSSIYRDNVIGVIANYFGYGSGTNHNRMGYQSEYVPKADLYASGTLRAWLGSSASAGDYVYLTVIYHGNTG